MLGCQEWDRYFTVFDFKKTEVLNFFQIITAIMTLSTQTQLRKCDNELDLQKMSQFEGGDNGGVGLRAI